MNFLIFYKLSKGQINLKKDNRTTILTIMQSPYIHYHMTQVLQYPQLQKRPHRGGKQWLGCIGDHWCRRHDYARGKSSYPRCMIVWLSIEVTNTRQLRQWEAIVEVEARRGDSTTIYALYKRPQPQPLVIACTHRRESKMKLRKLKKGLNGKRK